MLTRTLKIKDKHFIHVKSAGSNLFDIKSPIEWIRNFDKYYENEYIFYTDSCIEDALQDKNKNKILWVLESPAMIDDIIINRIIENNSEFRYILTHDDRLVGLNNSILFPIGGCWINRTDCQVYEKTINRASLILSNKNFLEGHQLRFHISKENLTDNYGMLFNKLDYKLNALKDYKFHVCIENTKNNFYFTEKIIDCFATGTIPIYWGSKKIDNFFNGKGVITVENFYDLKFALKNIELIDIDQKIIEENFELSKKYWVPECRIERLFSS